MKEKTEADVPLVDSQKQEQENENQDEERCPLKNKTIKYDITQENIEEREKLQIVLKKIENTLNEDLLEEKKKKMNQAEEKKEGKEKKTIDDLDFLLCYRGGKDKKGYDRCLFVIFSIFLPFFIIINLLAIFQIISVMNAMGEVIKRSIKCYLGWDDGEEESYYEFKNFFLIKSQFIAFQYSKIRTSCLKSWKRTRSSRKR